MRQFSMVSLAFTAYLSGCGGKSDGTGRMEVRLVDAPADDVKEVVVTITRVEAHLAGGGGWQTLAEQTATVNLLELQGGSFVRLGVASLPTGRITQLRLYVKEDGPNYVTTPDDVKHPLTVPSGTQSGIKIKAGFDWPACADGHVTIDFDGKKSLFVHPKGNGAGDEWLLRPVIRLKSVKAQPGSCDPQPPIESVDGGASEPPVTTLDGGQPVVISPPIMMPPTEDACGAVTCPEGAFCFNGQCLAEID
jgi:hypothetical protein